MPKVLVIPLDVVLVLAPLVFVLVFVILFVFVLVLVIVFAYTFVIVIVQSIWLPPVLPISRHSVHTAHSRGL